MGRYLIAPALDRIGRKLNGLALELLEVRAGEAALDVGIGGGGLLKRLSALQPLKVAGVDISEEAVARARRRFGQRVEVVKAGAEALPFDNASFDAVAFVSVLHFWRDLGPPLREIARVLRPCGRLVLVFEPPDALRRWRGHVHGFQLWEVDQVVAAAEHAGLQLETRREGHGFKPDFFVGLRFRKDFA